MDSSDKAGSRETSQPLWRSASLSTIHHVMPWAWPRAASQGCGGHTDELLKRGFRRPAPSAYHSRRASKSNVRSKNGRWL